MGAGNLMLSLSPRTAFVEMRQVKIGAPANDRTNQTIQSLGVFLRLEVGTALV